MARDLLSPIGILDDTHSAVQRVAAPWLGVLWLGLLPYRFLQALGLEYLSRAVLMVEYVLIALGVGLNITYLQAYVIGGLTSLIQNVMFIVPFEVGTKEGSLYLMFQLLGLDPALGVYTAIVSRLRDIAWIGVGLALVWLSGRRASPPDPLSTVWRGGTGVRPGG